MKRLSSGELFRFLEKTSAELSLRGHTRESEQLSRAAKFVGGSTSEMFGEARFALFDVSTTEPVVLTEKELVDCESMIRRIENEFRLVGSEPTPLGDGGVAEHILSSVRIGTERFIDRIARAAPKTGSPSTPKPVMTPVVTVRRRPDQGPPALQALKKSALKSQLRDELITFSQRLAANGDAVASGKIRQLALAPECDPLTAMRLFETLPHLSEPSVTLATELRQRIRNWNQSR